MERLLNWFKMRVLLYFRKYYFLFLIWKFALSNYSFHFLHSTLSFIEVLFKFHILSVRKPFNNCLAKKAYCHFEWRRVSIKLKIYIWDASFVSMTKTCFLIKSYLIIFMVFILLFADCKCNKYIPLVLKT